MASTTTTEGDTSATHDTDTKIIDFLLGNYGDGYGDISMHLNLVFWQHFFAVVSGDNVEMRMVIGERLENRSHQQMSLSEIQTFAEKFFGDYNKLFRQAYYLLETGLVQLPEGVVQNMFFSEEELGAITMPKIIEADGSAAKASVLICGPYSEIPAKGLPMWDDVGTVIVYNEYNAPSGRILDNTLPGDEYRLEIIRSKLPEYLHSKIILLRAGVTEPYMPREMIAPLPGRNLDPEHIVSQKLEDLQYDKAAFIYARQPRANISNEFIEEMKKFLTSIEQDDKSKCLLILAGVTDDSPLAKTVDFVIKNYFKDKFEIVCTGFISNPEFNGLLKHPKVHNRLLTGNQSFSAFLATLGKDEEALCYDMPDHRVGMVKYLHALGVSWDRKYDPRTPEELYSHQNKFRFLIFNSKFRPTFGFECTVFRTCLDALKVRHRHLSTFR